MIRVTKAEVKEALGERERGSTLIRNGKGRGINNEKEGSY